MMNKKVTLNRKLSVSRLTGLISLLAIVLVAAFFINVPTLGVRAESSPVEVLGGIAPSLGTASSFGVLAATTVTNTGLTVVNGNLGVSPGTAVTGFGPGVVTNGSILTGINATAIQAQLDAAVAYASLAGQACDMDLTGQDLGGRTLGPGVYCFSSSVGLTGTLTLDGQGNPNAVFVFKIGSTLVTASASQVVLINGAQACNAFFQVGSSATLGTGTRFQGNIIALTSITVTTGTNLNGRAIALNGAVTLDTNNITNCASGPPPPPCTPFTTITEGDLFPGGIPSFGVSQGPGSITIDHVNAGTGTRSISVVSSTNAVINIPPFVLGTFNPVLVTFTAITPGQVDYTLRAASQFHSIFIRVRCAQQ
jgi:hypothetical protein